MNEQTIELAGLTEEALIVMTLYLEERGYSVKGSKSNTKYKLEGTRNVVATASE